MEPSVKQNLSCDKCGAPITITKIALKIPFFKLSKVMVVVGKCPEKHKKKFRIPLSTGMEALSILESHMLKCVKCDQPITFKISVKEDSDAKLKIKCPNHGTSACKVPIQIYNELKLKGKQIKQAKVVKKRLTESGKVGVVGLVFSGISLVHVFIIFFVLPNLIAGLPPGDIWMAGALYIGTGIVAAFFALLGIGLPLLVIDHHTTLSYTSMAFNGTLLLTYIILLLTMYE